MAKLKMLKAPTKPKLGKKPAQTASLSTKQAWLRRQTDKRQKYEAALRAVENENKKRKVINDASAKASTVIAGIGDILEVRPGKFTIRNVRAKRTSKVSGLKRKPAKKAPAKKLPKRKPNRRKY